MKPLTLVGMVLLGLILVCRMSPQQHFSNSVPVLATPAGQAKESQPENFKGQDFTVLLLGIDARGHEYSRTDAIMLARVDLRKGRVNLLSVPRDTRVLIDGVGYTKINHAHLLGEIKGGAREGTRETIKSVSNLVKCNINYFLKIDFQGFIDFVDTLGGVEVDLPQKVKLTWAGKTLPAGKQKLDGETALELVRERESLKDGDFGRQKNQALVLKGIVRKALEPKNLDRLPTLVRQLKREVIDMNFSEMDLISLAWLLKGIRPENVSYSQVPGRDGYAMDPLVKREVYYWIPDTRAKSL